MYTIKRAAELVGVSDSTLRAWERRYGLDLAQRTESGYRLYDDAAVDQLRRMNTLIASGWSAREAAEAAAHPVTAGTLSSSTVDTASLARAAAAYDVEGLTAILDAHFTSASFESVVDGWLLPSLRELGAAWEAGQVSVAGEHLAAHAVTRRLSQSYDAAGAGRSAPRVVIGLPPGAHHDLGLLAFATAARRAGLHTTYLGADVPADDWVEAVGEPGIRAAVLAVPMTRDATSLTQTVTAITAQAPDLTIAVGGSAQDLAPEGCLRLGHEVAPAARALADSLFRAD